MAIIVPLGAMWQRSLLPDSYDMAAMGYPDYGGGPGAGLPHGHAEGTPVTDLIDDPDRPPDVSETLTARAEGEVYTVNGTSPGPTIRATVGDMVEVTLINANVPDGATLHWHGMEVPNAMDGVAGVTQDAVLPGERFVYRFLADHAGTYWYHSHQISHEQVLRGLFGAIVVEPATVDAGVQDLVAVLHTYASGPQLNADSGTTTVAAQPGTPFRVRVINTDNGITPVWVTGTTYEVLAVDGYDITGPTPVDGLRFDVPAGGRVDLAITVPPGGARVDFAGATTLVLGEDPVDGAQMLSPKTAVDLLSYGTPADPGLDVSNADRHFTYRIGRRPGFLDGRPGLWWTINGHLYPDVPMFVVAEGDVVVFRIENTSGDPHPMHLHGHHGLVVSRNDETSTGSPWWTDSLEVGPGETFEVAFRADNPGLWMDHCHNLPHAVQGLVSHLMYAGVRSSFRVGGGGPHNQPE